MLLCVRTTIDIPDQLFRRAKKAAAEQDMTLREVVLRALRAHIETPARTAAYRFDWKVFPGALRPGLPIESNAALEEFFDPMTDQLPARRRAK